MITVEDLQRVHALNIEVEERLEHIVDIMTDCGVADFVPTNTISRWRYAPERNCVVAEKEYTDSHDECGDVWESYSIPLECLTMSDEELRDLFNAEYLTRMDMEHTSAIKQLLRDAEYLGYSVVPMEENQLRDL